MSKEPPKSTDCSELQIRREAGLAKLPNENSIALSEIVRRSLIHIQTSKELGARHRIGEHELCGPDYRLVCAFAEDARLAPEEVLRRLLLKRPVSGRLPPSCWESNIEDGRFVSLHVDISTLPIAAIPSIEGLRVETLHLELQEPSLVLDLSMFPNLTGLRSTDNQLSGLDLSHTPNLSWLWCDGNELSELELSPIRNLDWLYCGGNQLTELDLSKVPNLTRLWCGQNQLGKLDLSQVPRLEGLTCSGNQLTELDLRHVVNLTELQCDNNRLTELDVSQISNLSWLCCSGNQLTELYLLQVPNLKLLDCNGNQLTSLNLYHVPNLTDLSCEGNQLTELDIRNLLDLVILDYDPTIRIVQRPDQNF